MRCKLENFCFGLLYCPIHVIIKRCSINRCTGGSTGRLYPFNRNISLYCFNVNFGIYVTYSCCGTSGEIVTPAVCGIAPNVVFLIDSMSCSFELFSANRTVYNRIIGAFLFTVRLFAVFFYSLIFSMIFLGNCYSIS